MSHKIVVCTDHTVTWECLRRFAAPGLPLVRVERLEEMAGREGVCLDAVVVDDRFMSILARLEAALCRHSPVFEGAVFMTAGEALNALWNGPLGKTGGYARHDLSRWVEIGRTIQTPPVRAFA